MPIYTYKCKDCGKVFDLLVGVVAKEDAKKCKSCGSKKISRQMTSFSMGKSSGTSSCPTGTCPTCNL